jgi:hypothetical protein
VFYFVDPNKGTSRPNREPSAGRLPQTYRERRRDDSGAPLPYQWGGRDQDLPKFQIPFFIPKIIQTCSIYSPDGDPKVLLIKMTPS